MEKLDLLLTKRYSKYLGEDYDFNVNDLKILIKDYASSETIETHGLEIDWDSIIDFTDLTTDEIYSDLEEIDNFEDIYRNCIKIIEDSTLIYLDCMYAKTKKNIQEFILEDKLHFWTAKLV